MFKIQTLSIPLLASAAYAIFGNSIIAENVAQPGHQNFFANRIVRVHYDDTFVLVESPRLTLIHGRMVLHGRELKAKNKYLFDEDVSEPWKYTRSNGDVFVAWDNVTVCKSFDPGVFQLAGDE